jgi:hypothetical protein
MEARVYLEEEFFEALDNFKPDTGIGVIDEKSENRNQLLKIIEQSEIISPVQKKYFINLHRKLSQNYNPDNWKDFSFFRALRNNKLKLAKIDLGVSNSIFLLNKSQIEVTTINEDNNIISIGKDYDFEYPVSPKSFASKIVNSDMTGIECIKHRCRNVVLVDPYIFEDQPNFALKIPNLITFLKELYLDNSKTICYLSIITNNKDNNALFNSKIKEISDGINNVKLNISVYAHDRPHFKNNRHVITDYSIIDYQHLFDRDDASVSVNYLYDGIVSDNFSRAQILKTKIINNYNKDPQKMGLLIRKFGDILENNLLK